ncbi:MAG: hypothetical protein AAF220_01725 [Pseudomonadota bacterium]
MSTALTTDDLTPITDLAQEPAPNANMRIPTQRPSESTRYVTVEELAALIKSLTPAFTTDHATILNSVTDFIKTLLDDVDPDAARDTLQLGEVALLSNVGVAELLSVAPIHPEINTSDNRFTLTHLGSGEVQVNPSESFTWRGTRKITIDDMGTANTSVTGSANTTQLLYWNAPGTGTASPATSYPAGRLELVDTTAGNNSGPGFDANYDRMLIAEITFDGSSTPTFRELRNAAFLCDRVQAVGSGFGAANNSNGDFDFTLDWARRPQAFNWQWADLSVGAGGLEGNFGADNAHDHDVILSSSVVNRYQVSLNIVRDYAASATVDLVVWG